MLKRILTVLASLFIGSGFSNHASCNDFYLKGYLGAALTEGGKSNLLTVRGTSNPALSDHFSDASDSKSGLLTGVSWGMSINVDDNQFKVGIGYYWQDSVKQTGYIDELNDNQFRNYKYEYQIGSQRLMLEGSWLWPLTEFTPYLNVGIGYSRNHWSNYRDHVIDPNTVPTITPFKGNTESGLAWQLGGGAEIPINSEWTFDVRYLLVNLNDAKSGPDSSEYYQGRLKVGTVKSHQFMLGLSYRSFSR